MASDTVTSIQDMIERFRRSPPRSREERQRYGNQTKPLWWEKTSKSSLRDVSGDTSSIVEKYGLLSAEEAKIGRRALNSSALIDHLFASAESKDDKDSNLFNSDSMRYLRDSHTDKFRSSLRDSWESRKVDICRYSNDTGKNAAAFSSSSHDGVIMRMSSSDTLGNSLGLRSLLRSELRLDGSKDFATDKEDAGSTGLSQSLSPRPRPADPSLLPAKELPDLQLGLEELLSRLKRESEELQKKYESTLECSALVAEAREERLLREGLCDSPNDEEDESWEKIISRLEAIDKAKAEKEREENENLVKKIGKIEQQWKRLTEGGAMDHVLPGPSLAQLPAPHPNSDNSAPDQPISSTRMSRADVQESAQRRPQGNRRVEVCSDESWRDKEYRLYLELQEVEAEVEKTEEQATGRGCWQGYGKFPPLQVGTEEMCVVPRWVPALVNSKTSSPSEPKQEAEESSVCEVSQLTLDESTLDQRMEQLDLVERSLQDQINVLKGSTSARSASFLDDQVVQEAAPEVKKEKVPVTFSFADRDPFLPLAAAGIAIPRRIPSSSSRPRSYYTSTTAPVPISSMMSMATASSAFPENPPHSQVEKPILSISGLSEKEKYLTEMRKKRLAIGRTTGLQL